MGKVFTSLDNLIFLIKPYWKYGKLYFFGRVIMPVFVSPALVLLQVSLVQEIIDAIMGGATMRQTIQIAAMRVIAIFFLTATRWSFSNLYERWKHEEIRIKINRSIYEKAIKTDYKYFDNPDFYNTFTFAASEFGGRSESALQLVTQIAGSVSVIIAMTAYLSELGPLIVIITLAGQVISLIAQRIMQKLNIKRALEALPFDRRLTYTHRIAYQRQYAADMKSTSLPKTLLSMFDRGGKDKVNVFKRFAIPITGANLLENVSWSICQVAQLIYMIYCVFSRHLGVGTIAGMFTAASRLHEQLNMFVMFMGRILELILYADNIRTFFDYDSVIEPQLTGASPPEEAFSLELRNMTFFYPDSDFGLKNLNIKIKPNEKIAIVGENGAGKTTLAKLLLRLYDADDGEILYNGLPISSYDIHKLRLRIGMSFQDPQLYAFTVRENMELYNTSDTETLSDILKKVGLDIAPDREVTREFDDRGIMLSGGQSQKLGLTRLLHGSFGLLLLDEPSSSLDPLAEYAMTKLIFDESNTTTIMVAHRLSTVRDADRIYLIDNGEVTEEGAHDELMALGGKYAEMFNKQAENYIK